MQRKAYTGIGSRATPVEVCTLFTKIASRLELLEWTLLSGGASGADTAFEAGVANPSSKMIFVPWESSTASPSRVRPKGDLWHEAAKIAREIHPGWSRLGDAAKALHTRNVFQVLGADLKSPTRMVICWTADGAEAEAETSANTGGTRTAIVLAFRSGVPVVNFRRGERMSRLKLLVEASGTDLVGDEDQNERPPAR